MKNRLTIVTFLMLILAFSLGIAGASGTNAYAAEDDVALSVYYQKEPEEQAIMLKNFTKEDLKALAASEENLSYTFSGFSTYPTAEIIQKVTGPTVAIILNEALGTRKIDDVDNIDGIANNHTIEFLAPDGVKEWFTKAQLFNEDRYYFPNIRNETDRCGQPVKEDSFEGKVPVPAVISLTENDKDSTQKDDVGRLLFGQTVPNEQNRAEFVKYMIDGGKITIRGWDAAQWKPITSISSRLSENLTNTTTSLPIGGITLGRDANIFHQKDSPRYWVFYTTDGSEPTNRSNMYNYNNFEFGHLAEEINKPTILEPGQELTVKVKVWGYGKLDSDVTAMTFVGKNIAAPNLKTVSRAGYASINITWSKVKDVVGYKVYRSAKNKSNFTLLKTLRGDSVTTYKDTTCETGTKYYYKVNAFTTYCNPGKSTEKTLFSPDSNIKYATATLTKPVISKLTPGKKKITIKWNKVAGANGYVIYRSTKKASGYKAIKTIKSGSTVKYINKGLKKNKKYYYKIKAYRNVNSVKRYSVYSAVKSAKTKK